MSESKFLTIQRDVCEPPPEQEPRVDRVCPTCIPNEAYIPPDWWTQSTPFLNERTCEYSVAVFIDEEGEFYRVSDLNLSLVLLGSSFISLALILPVFLKPFYLLWMFFAVALGWFMTRLMLGLLFYLIVSPIGVISRLFGKEFLELNKSKLNNSYWNYLDSKKVNNQHYEKQF